MKKPTFADILRDRSDTSKKEYKEYPDSRVTKIDPREVRYNENLVVIHDDGNCMFRAIAFAVGDADIGHAELREKICDWVAVDPHLQEAYQHIQEETLAGHVHAMRHNGVWGGETELIAAAHVVRRYIIVWTNGAIVQRFGDPQHEAIHLNYVNGNTILMETIITCIL